MLHVFLYQYRHTTDGTLNETILRGKRVACGWVVREHIGFFPAFLSLSQLLIGVSAAGVVSFLSVTYVSRSIAVGGNSDLVVTTMLSVVVRSALQVCGGLELTVGGSLYVREMRVISQNAAKTSSQTVLGVL